MKGIINCYISYRGVKMNLEKVKISVMDKLLETKSFGIPLAFDSKGRIWPAPEKDLKIVRE